LSQVWFGVNAPARFGSGYVFYRARPPEQSGGFSHYANTITGDYAIRKSRVMEYKIVSSHMLFEVEQEVRALIRKGWTPIGGIAIAHNSGSLHYAQAMIREQTDL
jgi:hypothetical protein